MRAAAQDDWAFSLISLQTQAPYPGSGNFGIARMNGGSSSRPGLGVDPYAGILEGGGVEMFWLVWDIVRTCLPIGYKENLGFALLWLLPWDGESGLSFSQLDPYFIEVCRRVRLVQTADGISALRATTKGAKNIQRRGKGSQRIYG
jgi:CRISPR system Cascade subunit CasA